MDEQTSFERLDDSTREDWELIMSYRTKTGMAMPDHILEMMKLLEPDHDGYPVNRLQHCLQTAALAAEDGRDDEYVVCALLHDIGDLLGIFNHADISAAVLEPFVSDANHWMIKHHAIFQGYNFFHHIGLDRNLRDQYRGSPHFDHTEEFVRKYDNEAFKADWKAPSLEHFAPLVRKIMLRPRHGMLLSLVPDEAGDHE